MHRILLVILAFVSTVFLVFFICYNISYEKKLDAIQCNSGLRTCGAPINNDVEVAQLKKENILLQENINSLNTRFNDLYLLGATIVVLLLAITVGVYLKTESEVEKHFTDNFDSSIKRIKEYEVQAEELLGKMQAYFDSQKRDSNQNTPSA